MIRYIVADYSKCKKGDAFRTEQIEYLATFDNKSEAVSYAKRIHKKNIAVEEWETDEDGNIQTYIDNVEN